MDGLLETPVKTDCQNAWRAAGLGGLEQTSPIHGDSPLGTVLDRLRIGLLSIDECGNCRLHNDCVRRIVGSGDGLSLESGRLIVEAGSARRSFKVLMRSMLDSDFKSHDRDSAIFVIERPSGAPGYIARTTLTQGGDRDKKGCVWLLLIDPCMRCAVSATALKLAYGLTNMQSNVVVEILRGHRPREVALRMSVSFETVRSHIRAALAKCGCKSQVELATLLIGSLL